MIESLKSISAIRFWVSITIALALCTLAHHGCSINIYLISKWNLVSIDADILVNQEWLGSPCVAWCSKIIDPFRHPSYLEETNGYTKSRWINVLIKYINKKEELVTNPTHNSSVKKDKLSEEICDLATRKWQILLKRKTIKKRGGNRSQFS